MEGDILQIMNAFINSEQWPAEWARDRIRMLHKGKSKKDLNNYRGIAIGSNIAKLGSRLVTERLKNIVEESNMLGEIQCGFREGRSTTDNLLILREVIEGAGNKNKVILAFIDLRKAYNRVWRQGLWKCLRKKKLGGKCLRLIQSMYQDTKAKVKTSSGETNWIDMQVGVKQGCPLSPLLFAIFMSELGDRLMTMKKGIDLAGIIIPALFFADDLVLMARKEEDLSSLLEELAQFTKEWKLEINQDKSLIMRTKTRDKNTNIWCVKTEEEEIEFKETDLYKYLGVYLNRNGNIFKNHVENLIEKGKSKVNAIKIIANESMNRIWTADALWKGAARPAILYASEAIRINQTDMKRIESIQGDMGR